MTQNVSKQDLNASLFAIDGAYELRSVWHVASIEAAKKRGSQIVTLEDVISAMDVAFAQASTNLHQIYKDACEFANKKNLEEPTDEDIKAAYDKLYGPSPKFIRLEINEPSKAPLATHPARP